MSSTDNLLENTKRPDDISVRGLLLKAKEYLLLLIRRWWLIILFAGLFAGQSFYSVRQIKPVYPGEIVLLVNTQNTAKENKNRILVFSRFVNSHKVFKKILLEPVDSLDGDLLINKYLQTYFKFKPEGLSNDIPENFVFTHTNPAEFTDIEALVFKNIIEKISTHKAGYADGFVNVSLEESLGLITLGISTPDPDLTMLVIDKINMHFQDLVFNYSAFAETTTYKDLKFESDTLENKYRIVASSLSRTRNDYQRILNMNGDTVTTEAAKKARQIEYLEVEADIYKSKYLVTLKELKNSQNNMNLKKPIVEVLRETLPPLEYYKPSALRSALKMGLVGAFFMIVLIILHKVFMDILEEGQ